MPVKNRRNQKSQVEKNVSVDAEKVEKVGSLENTEKVEKTKAATKTAAKKPAKTAAKKPAKTAAKTKKVTKKQPKKQTKAEEQEGEDGDKKRFFQIVDSEGNTKGRFAGHKPKQAANKAFTSLLKDQMGGGKDQSDEIAFNIVECTRNSKHKVYSYIGQRIKLEKPMIVNIQGKNIEYKFNNVLKKNTAVMKKKATRAKATPVKATETKKQVRAKASKQ